MAAWRFRFEQLPWCRFIGYRSRCRAESLNVPGLAFRELRLAAPPETLLESCPSHIILFEEAPDL